MTYKSPGIMGVLDCGLVLIMNHGADEQVGSVLYVCIFENDVFIGTIINRKIVARDV